MSEEWIYVGNYSNEKVKSFRCNSCNWIIQQGEVVELGEDKHRCFTCECRSILSVDCEHRYLYDIDADSFICDSCGLLQKDKEVHVD